MRTGYRRLYLYSKGAVSLKRVKKAVATLLIALLALSLCGCDNGTYSRREIVLGSSIMLSVSARGGSAKKAADEMFELASAVFDNMDLSNEVGTLSRFNRADKDVPIEIDEHIYNLIKLSETVYDRSGGAFDPTSLPLSKLWKVDISSISGAQGEALPEKSAVDETLLHVGMDKISCYESEGKYYLEKSDPKAELDLGGIAKGYFVDLCVEIARENELESALIDLSGNIYLYGGSIKSGGDWQVGIISPRPRGFATSYVAAVRSPGNTSFVTTGDYQRYYLSDEGLYVCHVIDPRSGLPIGITYDEETGEYAQDSSAVISATVCGSVSASCDAYSTAVAVLGAGEGAELMKEQCLSAFILTGDKKRVSVGEWDMIAGYDEYLGYESVGAL